MYAQYPHSAVLESIPSVPGLYQSDLDIGPNNDRFSGMSSILFPQLGSRYVLVPSIDLYRFRVLLCRRLRYAVQT